MSNGKLIVIEGIDGSGKSTQYKNICEKLKESSICFENIVFPRYDCDSSALIRMYLNGKFGSHPDDVNAYTASTFFAVDRFASFKEDWGNYYNNGGLILSDRYTTSNIVHQGSKIKENLNLYFDWLTDLEYNKMGLPKPDRVFYLDVDIDTSISRMRKREHDTNTTADIHETDINYLSKCLETASYACDYFNWDRISFKDVNGNERSIEDKTNEIYNKIKDFLNA